MSKITHITNKAEKLREKELWMDCSSITLSDCALFPKKYIDYIKNRGYSVHYVEYLC